MGFTTFIHFITSSNLEVFLAQPERLQIGAFGGHQIQLQRSLHKLMVIKLHGKLSGLSEN